MWQWIVKMDPKLVDIGLLIIRLGLGAIFIGHGGLKLMRGHEEWLWTGQQMKVLGITFFPLFWGLCAVAAELCGGISLILGLFVRLVLPFSAFTMLVAVLYHVNKGDSFGYISHPAALFFVFLGLAVAGAGRYSLDYLWFVQ